MVICAMEIEGPSMLEHIPNDLVTLLVGVLNIVNPTVSAIVLYAHCSSFALGFIENTMHSFLIAADPLNSGNAKPEIRPKFEKRLVV